jgi:hypothetical protein
VSRSFELLQLASVRTFQQHVRTTLSVRPAIGFLSKAQIWEDHCNRPDDVDSRSDALIHKPSCAFKIHASGKQPSWSRHASYLYGNCVHLINRPDNHSLGLDQLWDFFPKHRYRKIVATIQTMWIPVRTRSSIRQVAHSKFRRPDDSLHGPDTRATYMELA